MVRNAPLAAEAVVALIVADVAVRLLPSPRTTKLLGTPRAEASEPGAGAGLPGAVRVGRAVRRAAAALPWHPVCLPQAIATRWLLRRRGIACVCHLGVVATHPFSAHAWVTVGGATVQGAGVAVAGEVAQFA